jgi:hypothetical protein
MAIGIPSRIVAFTRPFMLAELGRQFPAGRYFIETMEEPLDGAFPAIYPQAATTMHLIAGPRDPDIAAQTIVDPFQLEAALALDATLANMSDAGEMFPLIASWRAANWAAPTEGVAGTHSTKVAP